VYHSSLYMLTHSSLFPRPKQPQHRSLPVSHTGKEGQGIWRGNADLWNVNNSFTRDVISIKFYKMKKFVSTRSLFVCLWAFVVVHPTKATSSLESKEQSEVDDGGLHSTGDSMVSDEVHQTLLLNLLFLFYLWMKHHTCIIILTAVAFPGHCIVLVVQ